jgi:LacI family transcriptional regulator
MRRKTIPQFDPQNIGRVPLVGFIVEAESAMGREIFHGVTEYVRTHDVWRFLLDMHLPTRMEDRWRDCDGLIVMGNTPELRQFLADFPKPKVNVTPQEQEDVVPTVRANYRLAGKMAAEHLLERGVRHFGFHGWPRDPKPRELLEGFASAIRKAKCKCCIFDWPFDESGNLRVDQYIPAVCSWLRNIPRPSGILASNDYEGRSITQVCWESSLVVPDDVAVLGVGNDDLLCPAAYPPLSSVDPGYRRIGYEAAKALHNMLRGKPAPTRPIHLAPLRVVARQSSDIMALDDPLLARAIRLLREGACGRWAIQGVLRQVPITRRWLERQCRRVLGRSPHEEITRLRIERARQLLSETHMPIPEIAQACGYGHVQNLAENFRQNLGQTPAAYRRKFRMAEV